MTSASVAIGFVKICALVACGALPAGVHHDKGSGDVVEAPEVAKFNPESLPAYGAAGSAQFVSWSALFQTSGY